MPSATLTFTCSSPPLSAQIALTYTGLGHIVRLELTGAQTYPVDLGMIPAEGCKGVLVLVGEKDAAGAALTAPVTLRRTSNAVSKDEEISGGGAFMIASPSPANGITAISIVTTANAVVQIIVLG